MAVLDDLAASQASWSATADTLKKIVGRARTATFALGAIGALAASIAGQLPADLAYRAWVSGLAAICLGIATFLTARFLTGQNIQGWGRARIASEGMKRAGFLFATRSAPYDGADAEQKLTADKRAIETAVQDLVPALVDARPKGSTPTAMLPAGDYVVRRLSPQIEKFYEPASKRARHNAARLRAVELGLALVATAITILATIVGKHVNVAGVVLDLAAFTAVLTTVGGAVLAHLEAQRFDFLASIYQATAGGLRDKRSEFEAGTAGDTSTFVNACEALIASENGAWMAKLTGRNTP